MTKFEEYKGYIEKLVAQGKFKAASLGFKEWLEAKE